MLSCKEAAERISEGLDRELSLRQRISLRLHVLLCSACRAYRRQVEGLDRLVRRRFRQRAASEAEPPEPPGRASLDTERRRAIEEALRRAWGGEERS